MKKDTAYCGETASDQALDVEALGDSGAGSGSVGGDSLAAWSSDDSRHGDRSCKDVTVTVQVPMSGFWAGATAEGASRPLVPTARTPSGPCHATLADTAIGAATRAVQHRNRASVHAAAFAIPHLSLPVTRPYPHPHLPSGPDPARTAPRVVGAQREACASAVWRHRFLQPSFPFPCNSESRTCCS
jgi:hypothetical protein